MKQMLAAELLRDELIALRARKDLRTFSEFCWQDDPEHRPNGLFQKEWYYILQADQTAKLPEGSDPRLRQDLIDFIKTDRLHLEGPREHAKTTCISVKYPLWKLGQNQNQKILVVSKTATLATDIIRECKLNVERNEKLQMAFPELQPGKPWSDKEIQLVRSRISKTPTMRGVGLHGSITGGRADIVLLDDPFDEKEVRTRTQRDKVAMWIEKVVIPVLSPTGTLIAVGTRWHYGDYWGNLIAKDIKKGGMYVVKIYRAFQEDKTALWPEVWPVELLNKRKAEIGSLKFNCLYMNDPSGLEGLIFKEKWLQYYDPNQLRFFSKMLIFQGVDPAISEDPKADYTAIVTLAFNYYRNCFYILDIFRGHLDFPDQVRMIEKKYKQWKQIAENYGWALQAVGVESVAYQKALARTMFVQGLPIKEIKRKQDKLTRMVGLSPHFEGGRFFLPDPAIEKPMWLEPFIEEYVGFPRGVNDDMLDALDCAVEAAGVGGARDWAFYFG